MHTHIATTAMLTMQQAHDAARALDALREEAVALDDEALIERFYEVEQRSDVLAKLAAAAYDDEIRRRQAARYVA